jgi:hypothetical protein
MSNNSTVSFSDGIIAAVKVGTANALSVIARPIYTAQVILGMKEGNDVAQMIVDEVDRKKNKVHLAR